MLEIAQAEGGIPEHERVVATAGLDGNVVGDVLTLLLRHRGAQGNAGPGVVAVLVDPGLEDAEAVFAPDTFQAFPGIGILSRFQDG